MNDLLRCHWGAIDVGSGVKVSIGLIMVLLLMQVTGETWVATGLVVMFAWFTNTPGPQSHRVGGMVIFGVGAIALTIAFGQMELDLLPNVIAIALVGFFGTVALVWGTRAFMVGWALICWAIYGPFLVSATSVLNCILAVVVGTGTLIVLSVVGGMLRRNDPAGQTSDELADGANATSDGGFDYVLTYGIIVALVLAFTTYFGWAELKTDPTLMAGGAFFVIGFDVNKTWIAGFGRLIGLAAGSLVGLVAAFLLGEGFLITLAMIAACGLSFATVSVHPGAWMFFFMVFVSMGWFGLDPDAFSLVVAERFYGETLGVIVAMIAILFLQWRQNARQPRQ